MGTAFAAVTRRSASAWRLGGQLIIDVAVAVADEVGDLPSQLVRRVTRHCEVAVAERPHRDEDRRRPVGADQSTTTVADHSRDGAMHGG